MSFCFTGCQFVDEALSKDGEEVSDNQVADDAGFSQKVSPEKNQSSPEGASASLDARCSLVLNTSDAWSGGYRARNVLRSVNDDSPLHKATYERDVRALELLIAGGYDPNKEDEFGRTALHWVTYFRGSFSDEDDDVVELLLEKGADPNIQDACGNTPLHYITELKKIEIFGDDVQDIAEYLLKKGARLDITNKEGLTPYEVAVKASENDNWVSSIGSHDLLDEFDDWIEEQKEKENE